MKEIIVTNGQNSFRGPTRATTEAGYIRAAKRIWPYTGLSRVKIRVFDWGLPGDPCFFETKVDIC